MKSEFGPNVTCLYSREMLKSLRISNGNYKSMNTVVFTLYDKLSKYKCMSCNNTKVSRPELSSCNAGGIDSKGIVLYVIGGCSL